MSENKFEPCPSTFIFIPPRIKTVLLISFNYILPVELIVSEPFGRQKHTIIPKLGGTLVCLCNVNRFFYNLFLESKQRHYRIVKVKLGHVLLLIEQVFNPHLRTTQIPRLWDLAAINLLLQGYDNRDCTVLLEAPLLGWCKFNLVITPLTVSYSRRAPFLSCASPHHKMTWLADTTLPDSFWDANT